MHISVGNVIELYYPNSKEPAHCDQLTQAPSFLNPINNYCYQETSIVFKNEKKIRLSDYFKAFYLEFSDHLISSFLKCQLIN